MEPERSRPTDCQYGVRISLLGRFELAEKPGAAIPVAAGTQRLLALLALRSRVVHRAAIAGALWPEVSDRHALASLRSTLLRIPTAARPAVAVTDVDINLAEGVSVDFRDAQALAHRLLDGPGSLRDSDLATESIATLAFDLLPGWTDEWVVNEAEEWRQLRLHALEALTNQLVARQRFADATAAAMAAIRAEPLRRERARGAHPRASRGEQPVGGAAAVRAVPDSPAIGARDRADTATAGVGRPLIAR